MNINQNIKTNTSNVNSHIGSDVVKIKTIEKNTSKETSPLKNNIENNKNIDKKQNLPKIENVISDINNKLDNLNVKLNYSIDKDTGESIIKLIDKGSNEVIKQIPSEDMLKVMKSIDKFILNEKNTSIFINEKV